MNSFLKILLVLIFTAQVGPAQTTAPAPQAPLKAPATTSPARLPGVDQILDRYVVAVGGADALRKVRTRRVLGEFEFEGMNMTGSLESLGSAPAQSVVSLDVPGVGQFRQVVNGEKAWALDPLSGLRELTGAELAAYLRDAEFYRELNFKKLFAKHRRLNWILQIYRSKMTWTYCLPITACMTRPACICSAHTRIIKTIRRRIV